jgi:hypothetical protein
MRQKTIRESFDKIYREPGLTATSSTNGLHADFSKRRFTKVLVDLYRRYREALDAPSMRCGPSGIRFIRRQSHGDAFLRAGSQLFPAHLFFGAGPSALGRPGSTR